MVDLNSKSWKNGHILMFSHHVRYLTPGRQLRAPYSSNIIYCDIQLHRGIPPPLPLLINVPTTLLIQIQNGVGSGLQ